MIPLPPPNLANPGHSKAQFLILFKLFKGIIITMITLFQVSVLEGILNGGEGDKFKATASVVMTTNKAAAENDGKITSSACVLQ